MTVVYTVIAQFYDHPRPPEVSEPGVRYLMFSDMPMPACPPWEYMPLHNVSNGRATRVPKMLPHLHFACDFSVYHDGVFAMNEKPSVLIDRYLKNHHVAMFRHPCRRDTAEEAEACIRFGVGEPSEITAQVERWRAHGSPGGLWSGGVIIRDNSHWAQQFGELWWREYQNGCSRDQLALPTARFLSNVEINTIDLDIHRNDLFRFRFHAEHKTQPCNAHLEPERQRWLAMRDRVRELCQ